MRIIGRVSRASRAVIAIVTGGTLQANTVLAANTVLVANGTP